MINNILNKNRKLTESNVSKSVLFNFEKLMIFMKHSNLVDKVTKDSKMFVDLWIKCSEIDEIDLLKNNICFIEQYNLFNNMFIMGILISNNESVIDIIIKLASVVEVYKLSVDILRTYRLNNRY